MSYVNDNLMPNEKVLFTARIHPAIFLSSIVSLLVTIASVIFAFTMGAENGSLGSNFQYLPTASLCFSGLLIFNTIVTALRAIIVMTTTEFAVTNRRVIAKTGFIRRHTLEMLLSKVESVAVHQDITGRMLDFGTVIVTGTGGTKESFQAIAKPLSVRKVINEIIEQNTQANPQQQGTAQPGA